MMLEFLKQKNAIVYHHPDSGLDDEFIRRTPESGQSYFVARPPNSLFPRRIYRYYEEKRNGHYEIKPYMRARFSGMGPADLWYYTEWDDYRHYNEPDIGVIDYIKWGILAALAGGGLFGIYLIYDGIIGFK